jgi:hypothetical protein
MVTNAEATFVASFVECNLRERYLFMLNSRRRLSMLSRLYHHFDFDAKRIEKLKIGRGEEMALWNMLQEKSGASTCHVISTAPELDGKTLSLPEFVAAGSCWRDASIYIFDPKRVVLFHDEYDAFVLENTSHG